MVVLVAYRGNLGGLLVVQWLACRGYFGWSSGYVCRPCCNSALEHWLVLCLQVLLYSQVVH